MAYTFFATILKYTLIKLLGLLLLVNEPFAIVVKVALLKLDYNKFKYLLTHHLAFMFSHQIIFDVLQNMLVFIKSIQSSIVKKMVP
jgi:hypothetical protein